MLLVCFFKGEGLEFASVDLLLCNCIGGVAPSPLKSFADIPLTPDNASKVGVSLCESPLLILFVAKSCFATATFVEYTRDSRLLRI